MIECEQLGSSPRVWGTHWRERRLASLQRFIPTRVGNTPAGYRGRTGPTVHPHACGEHVRDLSISGEWGGSSPRVWGTQTLNDSPDFECRFIPTRVGNTLIEQVLRPGRSVHPHACGEHCDWPQIRAPTTRFIPTRVGNTPYFLIVAFFLAVHPHACGEHFHFSTSLLISDGSSPRVWGTQ